MPQPDWEDLERRIVRLEKLAGLGPGLAPAHAIPAPQAEKRIAVNPSAALPILGRALLGLAGAYLLRALAESGTIPARAGVAAGLLYAAGWLVAASRKTTAAGLEAIIYSVTSVLVFCPLLWEASRYFHIVSDSLAATLIAGYVLLAWLRGLPAIVTLAGLATAATLLIASRDVVPFLLAFLAIAAMEEAASCLGRSSRTRWLAAIMANLAVLLATWLVTGERGLPPEYRPIPFAWLTASQMALLAIYFTSTVVRTLFRGMAFTFFETAQCAAVFLIGILGGLRLSNGSHSIAIFALVFSAGCYLVSFVVLDHGGIHGRNFFVYSTFAILLALTGTGILFAGVAASAVWAGLAVACAWAGTYFGRLTLQVHGGIYLLIGLAGAGVMESSAGVLLGTRHLDIRSLVALLAGLLVTAVSYWLEVRDRSDSSTSMQMFRLAIAAGLAWLLSAALAGCLITICDAAAGNSAGHPLCTMLPTATLAGLALVFGWVGTRWDWPELSGLLYPAMSIGAYRLLMVEMSQDHKTALFLSLLAYGGALVTLPRLARKRAA